MAIYPKARRRLIYPESNLPKDGGAPYLSTPDRKPRIFIYHSAVGSRSLYGYFNRSDVKLESHTWIGLDPTSGIEQYLDNTRQADANFKANKIAMSWETADNGHPDSFEWTLYQQVAIAESMVWGKETYNIPILLPEAWDGTGMGYHTMWGAPSNWTPVAKSCPGTIRKRQFPHILVAARRLYTLKHNPPEGFDMYVDTPIPVEGAAKEFLTKRGADVGKDNALPLSWFVVWSTIETVKAREAAEQTNTKLSQLIQTLTQTPE